MDSLSLVQRQLARCLMNASGISCGPSGDALLVGGIRVGPGESDQRVIVEDDVVEDDTVVRKIHFVVTGVRVGSVENVCIDVEDDPLVGEIQDIVIRVHDLQLSTMISSLPSEVRLKILQARTELKRQDYYAATRECSACVFNLQNPGAVTRYEQEPSNLGDARGRHAAANIRTCADCEKTYCDEHSFLYMLVCRDYCGKALCRPCLRETRPHSCPCDCRTCGCCMATVCDYCEETCYHCDRAVCDDCLRWEGCPICSECRGSD